MCIWREGASLIRGQASGNIPPYNMRWLTYTHTQWRYSKERGWKCEGRRRETVKISGSAGGSTGERGWMRWIYSRENCAVEIEFTFVCVYASVYIFVIVCVEFPFRSLIKATLKSSGASAEQPLHLFFSFTLYHGVILTVPWKYRRKLTLHKSQDSENIRIFVHTNQSDRF